MLELFEPEFSQANFAYRTGLGPRQATARLTDLATPTRWVVIADIEKFDNVDYTVLLAMLREKGVDPMGLHLLTAWLLALSADRDTRYQPVKGLPQGTPVAPVLANIYLTGFDRAIEAERWQHVRYADDFVIIAEERAEAETQLRHVRTWLRRERNLTIKDTKTGYTSVAEGFAFVGFWFDAGGRPVAGITWPTSASTHPSPNYASPHWRPVGQRPLMGPTRSGMRKHPSPMSISRPSSTRPLSRQHRPLRPTVPIGRSRRHGPCARTKSARARRRPCWPMGLSGFQPSGPS